MTLAPNVRWEVTLEEDEDGNLILPIPPEVLEMAGWKEGDELDWKEHDDGSYVLEKVQLPEQPCNNNSNNV